MNASDNLFYQTYKNERPCWPLICFAIILNAVAIPGILMNLSLIYVTIRSKTLRGTANYLLALYSGFEILHQHGHLLFLYVAFSGQNFIEYRSAIRWSTVCIFGIGSASICMLLTGVDRLLCILCPFFSMVRQRIYLGSLTLVCSISGLTFVLLAYSTANAMPSVLITGTVGDLLKGYLAYVTDLFNPSLNICTIAIYVTVGILIHIKKVNAQNNVNTRVFRSLLFIIIGNTGGYLLLKSFRIFVLPQLGTAPFMAWFGNQLFAIPLNLSSASNAPILYFTSKEYRKAFRTKLFGIFNNSNQNNANFFKSKGIIIPVQTMASIKL